MDASLLLAAALAGSPQQAAQEPPQDPPAAVFRSAVTVRSVFVSVFDGRGLPVESLTKDDFALAEAGATREIAHFASAAGVPLDAILVIDASGSMAVSNRTGYAKAAAKDFIGKLRPQDQARVIAFNSSLDELTEMTSDKAALAAAVDSVKAFGGTALYDAVELALKEVPETPGRQRAIIVLSDGEDSNSLTTFEKVLDLARFSSASIYAVVAEEKIQSAEAIRNVQELGRFAEVTGGRLERVKDEKTLPNVYASIAAELAGKYQLGFYPADENGKPPVAVTLPKKRGLSVRATRASPL